MFSNPILKEIGDKHNKSIAQVILRWLTQRGVVALSKLTRIDRMKENFNVLDFKLSDEEMEKIASLDKKESSFFNDQTPEAVEMFFCFIDERRNKE